jgi:hypothetical protein
MPESRANAAAAAKEASGAAAKPRNTKAMDEQARALADRRKLARAAQFLESVFIYLFILGSARTEVVRFFRCGGLMTFLAPGRGTYGSRIWEVFGIIRINIIFCINTYYIIVFFRVF